MHDQTATQIAEHRRRIRIEHRFVGPEGLCNGGYLAGLLHRELGGPVEVSLRRPTPAGEPLWLARPAPDRAEIRDGDCLLVEARRAEVAIAPPPPVAFAQAREVSRTFLGFQVNPFPRCYVCSPQRAPGDALRIFAGAFEAGRVAAPWVPDPGAGDGAGRVAAESVAAALDCPGAWAIASVARTERVPMLLGGYDLRIDAPVLVGEPHVVVGAAGGGHGRKRIALTAVYTADGRLCAAARALWFRPADSARKETR